MGCFYKKLPLSVDVIWNISNPPQNKLFLSLFYSTPRLKQKQCLIYCIHWFHIVFPKSLFLPLLNQNFATQFNLPAPFISFTTFHATFHLILRDFLLHLEENFTIAGSWASTDQLLFLSSKQPTSVVRQLATFYLLLLLPAAGMSFFIASECCATELQLRGKCV